MHLTNVVAVHLGSSLRSRNCAWVCSIRFGCNGTNPGGLTMICSGPARAVKRVRQRFASLPMSGMMRLGRLWSDFYLMLHHASSHTEDNFCLHCMIRYNIYALNRPDSHVQWPAILMCTPAGLFARQLESMSEVEVEKILMQELKVRSCPDSERHRHLRSLSHSVIFRLHSPEHFSRYRHSTARASDAQTLAERWIRVRLVFGSACGHGPVGLWYATCLRYLQTRLQVRWTASVCVTSRRRNECHHAEDSSCQGLRIQTKISSFKIDIKSSQNAR